MNKQILSVIVSIIMIIGLVGLLVAGVLDRSCTTIKIDKDAKTILASKGIVNPETSELVCGLETCKFKMWQDIEGEKTYQLGSHTISARYCDTYNDLEEAPNRVCLSWIDYTPQELSDLKDIKVKEVLESYASVINDRDNKPESEVKLGKGTITISEKK